MSRECCKTFANEKPNLQYSMTRGNNSSCKNDKEEFKKVPWQKLIAN